MFNVTAFFLLILTTIMHSAVAVNQSQQPRIEQANSLFAAKEWNAAEQAFAGITNADPSN